MRTTIWIPNELAQEIKDEAWRARTSVSNYLVRLHEIARADLKELARRGGHSKNINRNPLFLEKPSWGDVLEEVDIPEKKKAEKPGWINPLTNSALAPKE